MDTHLIWVADHIAYSAPPHTHDFYHLISCFFLFSVLGWMVESIYMSFCNRKLTNRGFMTSPFCPIYGFGAVIGYLVLHPLEDNLVALYFVGAFLATAFEFLVAKLMLKLFGEVWWDYNYKGIVCLESTIAWGFYAVIIITFLFDKVMSFVDRYPVAWGIKTITLIFVMISLDFGYHFTVALGYQARLGEKIHTGVEGVTRLYHKIRK